MIHDCQGLHGFPENHMVMATLRVRMFQLGKFVSKNPCINDFIFIIEGGPMDLFLSQKLFLGVIDFVLTS